MRRGKATVALMGAIAAMAIVVGCGSSSDSLSKAEFIEQGDAICKKGLKEKDTSVEAALQKRKENPGKGSEKEENERLIVDVALPPVKTMAEELGDLAAPDGEEKEVEALVDALETALEGVKEDPSGVLANSEKVFVESNKMAADYGLKSCSQV